MSASFIDSRRSQCTRKRLNPSSTLLRRGKLYVITNAKQHRLGRPALFDYERPALVLDAAQKLAEVGTGPQGGDHYRAVFVSGKGSHELSISIN
jgi:hypothetical protein